MNLDWYDLYGLQRAPRYTWYDEGGMAMSIAIVWTHLLR